MNPRDIYHDYLISAFFMDENIREDSGRCRLQSKVLKSARGSVDGFAGSLAHPQHPSMRNETTPELSEHRLYDGVFDFVRRHQMKYPILGYLLQSQYHPEVSKSKFTHGYDIFRDLLKELRMRKKITQTDLAARLGQPQSYVSKYETGERRLDFLETVLVCEAIGIGIGKFAEAFSKKLKARHPMGAIHEG